MLRFFAIGGAFLTLAVLAAPPARAAAVTDVADAIDGDDPFDLNLELTLEYTFQRALLSRENTQVPEAGGPPRSILTRELDYTRHTARLMPRIEVGLFHDLSLFVQWPIRLWDQQFYGFTQGTTAQNSTIARDMTNEPTIDSWPERATEYGIPGTERNQQHNDWRFDLTQEGRYEKTRSGIEFPRFGLRFSPVNQERDDTKPTITLQADYKLANVGFLPLPVALDANDPADGISTFVADGTHRLHGLAAISKKFFIIDPYFVLDYNFPIGASDAQLGLEPRHDAGFWLGTEIVPYEYEEFDQKLAIDVGVTGRYFSPGRDYSELSDALAELTFTDEFVRLGAAAKVYFRAWKFIYFDVTGSVLYDTPHFLTTEPIGCDGGCPAPGLLPRTIALFQDVPRDEVVSLDLQDGERNPYYNPVVDTVGRRFKVEESFRFRLIAHVAVTF